MGRDALINKQILEDLIVDAFKMYESGLWPISMRDEAKAIIKFAAGGQDEKDT